MVTVAGLGDQFSAVTDGTGGYNIPGLFAGTYPKVVANGAGFFRDVESATRAAVAPVDFSIQRDWAASSGGASVVAFNGPNFAPAVRSVRSHRPEPRHGLGQHRPATTPGTPTNVFVDKHIVVDLQQAVDITTFGVDPNATCGDPGSSLDR